DSIVEGADADQRCGRAEDLLVRSPHRRRDVAEDGRRVVEAVLEAVPARDLAAGQELCALILADLGVRVDLLEGALVDHGADVGVVLPPWTQPQLLDAFNEP